MYLFRCFIQVFLIIINLQLCMNCISSIVLLQSWMFFFNVMTTTCSSLASSDRKSSRCFFELSSSASALIVAAFWYVIWTIQCASLPSTHWTFVASHSLHSEMYPLVHSSTGLLWNEIFICVLGSLSVWFWWHQCDACAQDYFLLWWVCFFIIWFVLRSSCICFMSWVKCKRNTT